MIPFPPPTWLPFVVPLAAFCALWSLAGGLALVTNRRVPPLLLVAPIGLWVPLAFVARLLGAPVPELFAALAWVIWPAATGSILLCAIAGPLRAPRVAWPAALAAAFALLGLLGLSAGALLDVDVLGSARLLFGLVPLTLAALIAQVRGAPESSGPEAGVTAAVMLAHAVFAGGVAWLALASSGAPVWADPTAWRRIGTGLAALAALGVVAVACSGGVTTRGRAIGSLGAAATLLPWIPLAAW